MLDRWLESLMVGARRHARVVAVAAAASALVGLFLVSRVSFDANILRLLPRDAPAVQSLKLFLESFGSLDHLYVVFDAPDGVNDHADLVHAYVDALRASPEIESVDSQLLEPDRDWTYLSDRVLLLLGPSDATDALRRFHPPRLDAELTHARDLLSMPSAEIRTFVQQDPLGFLSLLRTRLEQEKGAIAFDPTKEGYVSQDGHSRLVIVKPKGAPFDADFCKALFRRLTLVEQRARSAVQANGDDAASVTIQAAGAYRVSLEAEQLIRHDGATNALVSLVLLLLIIFAVFRTPRVLWLGTIPVALAALLSLGLNGLFRGSLSPATSGSAGMLFGLGIDGVILLYVRYLEERQEGATAMDATRRMASTASSVVLAQLTTVATFLALLLLDFPTLQDLGGLVGIGMLLVCPMTLILLPPLLPERMQGAARRAPSAAWLGRFVTSRSRWLVAIGIALTIGLGLAARGLSIDTGIERLQARTEATRLEEDLTRRFGLPRDVLLAVNENRELEPLIDADHRLVEEMSTEAPTVAVSGVGLLLPSIQSQHEVSNVIRASGDTVAGVTQDLQTAGTRAGFRPDTFAPFIARLPKLIDPNQRITYDDLIAHGLGPVVSRFLVRDRNGYRAVTYLYPRGPVDLPSLEAIVHRADPQLKLTGLPVVNRDLARRFVPEFVKGLTAGTIAVALLIYLVLRTVRHTLLALLPTAVGFIWSAGLLSLFHIQLDLFSLFAALTFIGIAVDYGIYILYRYVKEQKSIGDVLTRTGPAIAVSCLTALVGFGTLVTSSYPPLRVFGLVSLVTLTCCLVAALLFLPAVLLRLEPWSRPAR